MAEPAPAPRSPLAALADALAGARGDGVTLAERPARARLNLRLDPEDAEALAAAAVLGGALPLAPNTATDAGDGRTALWLGPDEWLLCGSGRRRRRARRRARRPRSPAATTRCAT